MLSKPLFMYPPVYLSLFILAQWGLSIYYPIVELNIAPWGFWLGAAIVALAVSVVLVINFQFKRAQTSIIPYQQSEALLSTGFFSLSRNPIYLMMALGLLGTGVMFNCLSGLLLVILFPPVIQWRFIRAEEAMVEEVFGEEYRKYKARVRRWI